VAGGWSSDEDLPSARDVRLYENSTRLYDRIGTLVEEALADGGSLVVDTALLLELHAIAMAGEPDAGVIRRADNQVGRVVALFETPPWDQVEQLLADAFAYLEQAMRSGPVLHAAAYALWRINAIHPFGDGNGRAARAVAYAVLCVGFGRMLPGSPTVPEYIQMNRYPYWDALQAADRAWERGEIDVSEMETVLAELVERQITSANP
jgi:Fic family protein